MDENTYYNFYKNTVLGYSKSVQHQIVKDLENRNLIVFTNQISLFDKESPQYFENKNDFVGIISATSIESKFACYYEEFEFIKLYKYSVPLFYSVDCDSIKDCLSTVGLTRFDPENYKPTFVLNSSISEAAPVYWEKDGKFFVKFVLQKAYVKPEDGFEQVDYRYAVVVYIDPTNQVLEIRYDSVRYESQTGIDYYERLVSYCIDWLKSKLKMTLYQSEHKNIIEAVKNKANSEVVLFKQMMELNSGASAELTTSASVDYVLPFIGELRELIEENSEIFDSAIEAKKLLLKYLEDMETTAEYPYIYIKWVKPVESQSYVVKVMFDYLHHRYSLMQHITGTCKDLRMGRMNEAIEYLCGIKAFTRGEEI